MGGAPKPLVKWAFQLSSFQKLVTKPLARGDPPRRRRLPRPARGGGPVHRQHDRLPGPHASGSSTTGSCAATRSAPAGSSSATAPSSCPRSPRRCWSSPAPPTASPRSARSRPWCRCSPAPREVRFEIVPGGHLGMLTGRAARGIDLAGARRVGRPVVDRDAARRPPRRPPRRSRRRRPPPRSADEAVEEVGRQDRCAEEALARPRRDRRQPDPSLRLGGLAQPGPLNLPRRRAPLVCAPWMPPRACRGRCGSATAPARWPPARSGPCPG